MVVTAVSRNPTHAVSKANHDSIRLVPGLGVEGDAHMGETVRHRSRVARDPTQPNLRQVHLIHGELHDELKEIGATLMCRALAAVQSGSAREERQLEQGATYAKKIDPAEARIDWLLPAAKLDCIIRGLSPRPGAWFQHRNERIRLLYAEPVNGTGAPGEFLASGAIACGEGALQPVQVQRAGRSATDWASFLRGFPLQPGERFT